MIVNPNIYSGESGKWTRPTERLPKPVINDNEIYWLFGVSELDPNAMAFSAASDGTQYRVDWGDGTVETINNNVSAQHNFSYSALSDVSVDSYGYKEVWIKLTPVNANENIVTLNLDVRPSAWSSMANNLLFNFQVLELYIRASELTTLIFIGEQSSPINIKNRYVLCEIFGLQENSISSCIGMLGYWQSLKQIDDLNINDIETLNYFMYCCYSYNEPFPDDITFSNVKRYFMNYCNSYNKPFPPNATFSQIEDYFMYMSGAFNQPIHITLSASNTSTHSNFLTGVRSVKSLSITNWNAEWVGFQAYSAAICINRDIIVALFNAAYDRSLLTTGTFNITGCYGASFLTSADKAIITSKNWNLLGA